MGFFDLFRKKRRAPAPSSVQFDDARATLAFAPTDPAMRAVAPPYEWVKPDDAPAGMAALLAEHAALAFARGLTPHVYFSAVWAPPCKTLCALRDAPKMQRAFAGTYIIELDDSGRTTSFGHDVGRFVGVVNHTVGAPTYPSFFELDARGELTGRTVNGSAWGADTAENMAPPLERYFHGR